FVLWFVDMQLPEANPPAIAFRNLRTTANRAFATANGLRKGVVHLNFPFRKPLEPTEVEGDMVELPEELTKQENHFVNIVQTQAHIGVNSMIALGHIINENRKGLFICCGNGPQPEGTTLYAIAETVNYPVIAEANSLMRHNEYRIGTLGAYDAYLKYAPKPDVIFRLGNVPVSKELNNFIANSGAQHVFYVTEDGVWSDDMHQNGTHIQTNFETLFQLWQEYLPLAEELPKSEFNQQYTVLEKTTWNTIDQEIETGAYFDGAVVYDIVDLIPDESTLFAGNSLPIRHLDQFGKPQNKRIYTYANRGASGIDGNISTALGAGAARPDKPLVAVMGDVTFYHDMNGLLAVHRCGVPVTIVLLNNDGGGIFNRLPIRDYDPHFTDYFVTPHGLDFSHTANLYGLDYVQIDARPESAEQTSARERFRSAFADVVAREKSTLIEVRTDGTFDDQRRKEIVATVGERIKAVGS
ncbi:MAG: thiamine pyrophosphate-dependent enzyme, partial [Chloroflexota bacterium]